MNKLLMLLVILILIGGGFYFFHNQVVETGLTVEEVLPQKHCFIRVQIMSRRR